MTAIYCRQSVDKKDSISIEQQEQACRLLACNDEECRVYSDKGFTGANTKRPQFEKMMRAVVSGEISRVIVYKVDRISRSLLDFVGIYGVFEKHSVEFISCSEQFDTSNAMGKATLQMIMVFAELERNMIQKRVRDNFYERAKKGLYLAGTAPFGFRRRRTVIDGINTSVLEKDSGEKTQAVELMYRSFLEGKSLGEIAVLLNGMKVTTTRGKPFSSTAVGRILRNTVYVKADARVYEYLRAKGANINQPAERFTGEYGCIVYGTRKNRTRRKFSDLNGDYVQLCGHEGIVSSEIWLRAQKRLDKNRPVGGSGRGRNTWLTGLTKCSFCGRGITVVNGQRNGKRYLNCTGRKEHVCCRRSVGLTFETVENAVGSSLRQRVSGFSFRMTVKKKISAHEENTLRIRMRKNLDEMERLALRVPQANETLMRYLNGRMKALDEENTEINSRLAELSSSAAENTDMPLLRAVLCSLEELSFDQRKELAGAFIDRVMIGEGEIEIYYK